MIDRLARAIGVFIALLLIAAVLINLCNVAGRYLFDKPIFWAEEGMVFLQIAIVVIGASAVSRDNAHLRMDAAEHLLPARLKRVVDLIALLATVAAALVVVWAACGLVLEMYESDQRSVALELPL